MEVPSETTIYEPWRSGEYPKLEREITSIAWNVAGEVQIEISERYSEPACLRIVFARPHALQAIDEGYRLQDTAVGNALIYMTRSSRYLRTFRANAASTMDNFPLIHWFIASRNQCVDVLSETEPEVISLL